MNGPRILRGDESTAGGKTHGKADRAKEVQSKERWSIIASTTPKPQPSANIRTFNGRYLSEANLALPKDGTEAIKQLEGSDDMTLHQDAGRHRRRCPPARTDGHLKEPSLQRKLANISAEHFRHAF